MTENPASGSVAPSMPSFQVRIPLEWSSAADTPIVYANQVMVSHAGPEFFLVFGVVLPPDSPDQMPDSLTIEPQVRVVVAREAMPAIVQALADNWQRFRVNVARQQQQPAAEVSAGEGPPPAAGEAPTTA